MTSKKYLCIFGKKLKVKKKLKIKKKINKLFFLNFLFIKKVFMCFVQKGKKLKIINFFIIFINLLKLKFIKNKTTLRLNVYIFQIIKKILPVINNSLFSKKGKDLIMPMYKKSLKISRKKAINLSINWIKSSVLIRKEKSLKLKIISELESIRNGDGNSIALKKQYYKEFIINKKYIKFLKKKNWT